MVTACRLHSISFCMVTACRVHSITTAITSMDAGKPHLDVFFSSIVQLIASLLALIPCWACSIVRLQ